jgi:hypothetical protein
MKLLASYNHTFSTGKSITSQVWKVIENKDKLTGLWLASPDYIETSLIGTSLTNSKVVTWVNTLEDGNYLYSSQNNEPTLTINDSQFNYQPSIDFSDDSFNQLKLKFPIQAKTIIIVYLTRVSGSYLIYAPRQTQNSSESETRYYDAFPPGTNGTLWGNEALDNNRTYNSRSRINGRDVSSNTYVPLNRARVLTITDFGGNGQIQTISGFGGQQGIIGGLNPRYLQNSVKGKIAAILTFSDILPDDELKAIETALGTTYVNYTGAVLTSTPKLKTILGNYFSFDLSTVVLDEWFDITEYSLISPIDVNLSITGSVLSGLVTVPYNGKLTFKVINSAGLEKVFELDLELCRNDDIVDSFPKSSSISLALSTYQNSSDAEFTGIYVDSQNIISYWEDCRRVSNSSVTNNSVPLLTSTPSVEPTLVRNDSLVNNSNSVRFTGNSSILSSSYITGKSFLWVYIQENFGVRPMLNTFPDIKGNGELWTISNTNQIHGQTDITKLITTVQTVSVNTLSYKNKLNTLVFITATQPENVPIVFNGFTGLRGKLLFFCSWNEQLTSTEFKSVITSLSPRYLSTLNPVIVNADTEYRTQANVTVDLKTKIVDLQNLSLSYLITENNYSATISSGILSFTAVRDEVVSFTIEVSNTIPLTTTIQFNVDITLKTNTLYRTLKDVIGTSNIKLFLIAELDSITLDDQNISEWDDYRESGNFLTGTNVLIDSLYQLDGNYTADFDVDGSSYLTLENPVSGKSFVIAYIKKDLGSGKSFLLGQSSSADFSSGESGRLFDADLTASEILNSSTYVNSKEREPSYTFTPFILNTIVINSTAELTVDTIAKDRVFTDSGVKGYIPLAVVVDRNITELEAVQINTLIRDYYDSPKFILLLHCNTISDSSLRNKALITTGNVNSSIKKFGSSSYPLVSNSLVVPILVENDTDFAFITEDFTVSFWINLNKTITEQLIIYNQPDLIIYIEGDKLYVGRNTFSSLSLVSYTLINTFYGSFNHIQVNKKDGTLYLFVNGMLTGSIVDEWEYVDYSTPVRIGQTLNLLTTGVDCYLDEFIVYRRLGFNSSNFTVPTVEYANP